VASGRSWQDDRPELVKALQACRVYGAKLVIAKLDRLSRDAHFLLGLEKAGVDFVAADMPHANRLTVGIIAMVADEERRMISQRTKVALAAAKKRGVKLGGDRGAQLSRAARKAGREAQSARAPTTRPICLLFSANWSETASRRGAASRGHSTTGASPLRVAEISGQQHRSLGWRHDSRYKVVFGTIGVF
jgi:DNA invertase Pin-like site-specific DNA recombinase